MQPAAHGVGLRRSSCRPTSRAAASCRARSTRRSARPSPWSAPRWAPLAQLRVVAAALLHWLQQCCANILCWLSRQVMGNNTGITIAGAWGQFELNVFKPMLIAALLQSVRCLCSSAPSALLVCIGRPCYRGVLPAAELQCVIPPGCLRMRQPRSPTIVW